MLSTLWPWETTLYREKLEKKEILEKILSLEMLGNRWKVFGHTLRLHKDTASQETVGYYFTESTTEKYRRRPHKLDE